MEEGAFIAIAVMGLATAIAQHFWPNRAKRINRALAAQPRAVVQEARGAVRLTGRVRRFGELLRAPLSGRPCVAYEILIDEMARGTWCHWVEERQARPFVVADESGEARVDTSGPFFLTLVHDRRGATGSFSRYPGKHRPLARLLEIAGIAPTGWLGFWKEFFYLEGVLQEGELVTVGGGSEREVDAAGDRPDPRSPPERLVLRGTEALPLYISDAREARGEPERLRPLGRR